MARFAGGLRALGLEPNAAVAANNLAWLYASSGENLDAALQLAQAATRVLPADGNVADTLGYVYYKKDMPRLAIPAFRASVAQEPDNPIYQAHLGLAYAQAGELANARTHLTAALRLKANFDGAEEARSVLSSLAHR